MRHSLEIVRNHLLLTCFLVLASFWAFIVMFGFVLGTLMPIVGIIQYTDRLRRESSFESDDDVD